MVMLLIIIFPDSGIVKVDRNNMIEISDKASFVII